MCSRPIHLIEWNECVPYFMNDWMIHCFSFCLFTISRDRGWLCETLSCLLPRTCSQAAKGFEEGPPAGWVWTLEVWVWVLLLPFRGYNYHVYIITKNMCVLGLRGGRRNWKECEGDGKMGREKSANAKEIVSLHTNIDGRMCLLLLMLSLG